jgi:hypothetical protein
MDSTEDLIYKRVAENDGCMDAADVIEVSEPEVRRAIWQLVSERRLDISQGLCLTTRVA